MKETAKTQNKPKYTTEQIDALFPRDRHDNSYINGLGLALENLGEIDWEQIVNKHGTRPLHSCIIIKINLDLISLLIKKGADVNARTDNGFAPIHFAAANNEYTDPIVLLIANKADINPRITSGQFAGMTPLDIAIYFNGKEAIKTLEELGARTSKDLERKTENPDIVLTPLQWALENSRLQLIYLLIEQGADVNTQICRGEVAGFTPLHFFTCTNGDAEAIALLIEKGADVNAKITSEEGAGLVPLHSAAANGYVDAIILLIANKADINARVTSGEFAGMTPLDLAIKENQEEAIKILKELGAKTGEEIDQEKGLVASSQQSQNSTLQSSAALGTNPSVRRRSSAASSILSTVSNLAGSISNTMSRPASLANLLLANRKPSIVADAASSENQQQPTSSLMQEEEFTSAYHFKSSAPLEMPLKTAPAVKYEVKATPEQTQIELKQRLEFFESRLKMLEGQSAAKETVAQLHQNVADLKEILGDSKLTEISKNQADVQGRLEVMDNTLSLAVNQIGVVAQRTELNEKQLTEFNNAISNLETLQKESFIEAGKASEAVAPLKEFVEVIRQVAVEKQKEGNHKNQLEAQLVDDPDGKKAQYYYGAVRLLNGLYVASLGSSSGWLKVDRAGNIGTVGSIFNVASGLAPIGGDLLKGIGFLTKFVGREMEKGKIGKFAQLFENQQQMNEVAQALALRLLQENRHLEKPKIRFFDKLKKTMVESEVNPADQDIGRIMLAVFAGKIDKNNLVNAFVDAALGQETVNKKETKPVVTVIGADNPFITNYLASTSKSNAEAISLKTQEANRIKGESLAEKASNKFAGFVFDLIDIEGTKKETAFLKSNLNAAIQHQIMDESQLGKFEFAEFFNKIPAVFEDQKMAELLLSALKKIGVINLENKIDPTKNTLEQNRAAVKFFAAELLKLNNIKAEQNKGVTPKANAPLKLSERQVG